MSYLSMTLRKLTKFFGGYFWRADTVLKLTSANIVIQDDAINSGY